MVNVKFVGGSKDGAELFIEEWESSESPLCERYCSGQWWWGASLAETDELYVEEHPRDSRDRTPPRQVVLQLAENATGLMHDVFRVFA